MKKGILCLAFLLFILVPGFSWLSGWNYRKEITITEQAGQNLVNYSYPIEIDTASLISLGKLNPDCSDLRFTDDLDNEISFWVDKITCDSANTKIYIKIPSLPAGNSITIYMYYGNPTAEDVSNITATFGECSCDFETGTCGWTGGTLDNGWYRLDDSDDSGWTPIVCHFSTPKNSTFEAQMKWKIDFTSTSYGAYWYFGIDDTYPYGCLVGHDSGDTPPDPWDYYEDSNGWIDLTTTFYENQMYVIRRRFYFNNDTETVWINGTNEGNHAWREYGAEVDSIGRTHVSFGSAETGTLWIDDFWVRDVVEPEPTYSVGIEETASNLDFSWSPFYPYTNETVNFTVQATDNYIQFCWDFNDSSTIECTTENTTTHVFGQAGDYQVKLIAYNNDTATNDTVVKIIHITNPLVINSITWTPDPLYKNEEATFSADVSGGSGSYTYSWDFGDGQTGSGNPATHTYTSAGTFQVNLTVQDSYGHQTYMSVEVPVYYLEVSISHDHEPVLNNETLTFEATYYSSNPAKNESFYWDFGDGSNLVKTIQPTITHVYYTTSDSQVFTACVNYSDGFRNATACQDITVYKPRLTDCTTLSTTKTLTFHLKKEQDPDSDVESTTERHLEVAFRISSSYGYEGGFSFNFVNATTQDICIYPATAEFLANATIQFWATGYSRRNYYLYNAELTNITKDIYLYLLPDIYSSQITIQVLDASSNGIYGVYVKALRYYVGEDAYKTVAMGQTDLDGRTVIPLQAYDTYYKFILEKDGQIIKEIPPMQIYSSTLTFQTALEPGLFWQWYGKIAYDCTFNNETLVYRCTVSDPTNLMQSSSLVVWKKGLTSDILICNTTVYSTSATLTCTFPDLNSTYLTYLYVDLGQGKALLHSQVFEFGGIRFNVSLGLIITLMLTLTLSLMGINHPDEVIILSVVGLLLGKIMGFAPISTASLISLIVVAGITIYREGI